MDPGGGEDPAFLALKEPLPLQNSQSMPDDDAGNGTSANSSLRSSYGKEPEDEVGKEEAARFTARGDQKAKSPGIGGASPEQPLGRTVMPAKIVIPIWIGLSGGLILLNKHIFTDLNFAYPVFMTAYHMLVATLGTRILERLPFERLKAKRIPMNWSLWSKTILPLSLLFSASLILSNMAYVYLNVSFVQMLKAFIPIFTLVIQLAAGIQEYNHILFGVVVVTAFGCLIAAAGEIKFAVFGFICQVAAVVVESVRLVLIQIILKDYRLDPLSSIAMYAPVCLALISVCLPFVEGSAPFHNLYRVGAPVLIMNGLIAFCLNIASLFLIDSAGSLVLTLSGVGKDVILICLAWVIGSYISCYAIAVSGLMTLRLTDGSPNTPNGRRLVRFTQGIFALPTKAIRAIPPALARFRGRNINTGSKNKALAGSGIILLILGALYFFTRH